MRAKHGRRHTDGPLTPLTRQSSSGRVLRAVFTPTQIGQEYGFLWKNIVVNKFIDKCFQETFCHIINCHFELHIVILKIIYSL